MITKVELGRDAITYIRSYLSDGNTLSDYLLKLPLEEGRVVTYLPTTASSDAMERFEVGGIIAPYSTLQDDVGTAEHKAVKLLNATLELKLANFILAYLSQRSGRYAVFEHALAKPGDPWLSQTSSKFFTYRSEVYFLLTSQEPTIESILTAVRAARTYRLTGILSTVTNMSNIISGQEIEQDILRVLAESPNHIIVGAYDNEAEIIWSGP